MVLMVTDCLAISTSTSKISPSELCSFIVGIFKTHKHQQKLTLKAVTEAKERSLLHAADRQDQLVHACPGQ